MGGTHSILYTPLFPSPSPHIASLPGMKVVTDDSAILVDSTRKGKKMPDALSKTVPIWCAVINRSISSKKEFQELHFPEESVSPQEIALINSLLPSFVESFKVSPLLVFSLPPTPLALPLPLLLLRHLI